MDFNIIGTGNMAWFLGKKLTSMGHVCTGIYGRNTEEAKKLSVSIGSVILNQIADSQNNADCTIIAVTDTAIKDIIQQLSVCDTVLIHTAGSIKREILDNVADHNGILWPIYSIVKDKLPEHRNIPIVTEGNTKKATQVLSKISEAITDIHYQTTWEERQWLHLCAVISNNFSNHLFAITEKLCIEHKLPFDLIKPIIYQTAERIETTSPIKLQTGPAIRADDAIIAKQLNMLRQNTVWQELYSSITTSIEKMYGKEGHKS